MRKDNFEDIKRIQQIIHEATEVMDNMNNDIVIPVLKTSMPEIYNGNQGLVETMIKGIVSVKWPSEALYYNTKIENVIWCGAISGLEGNNINFIFNLKEGLIISTNLIKVDENIHDALNSLYNAWDIWRKSLNGIGDNKSLMDDIKVVVQELLNNQ